VPGGPKPAPASFVFPVKGHPTFRNEFGVGTHRGGVWQNNGTDIFARRGTTVVAPISGQLALRTGGKGGNRFEIRGADGLRAYGAHLDRFFAGVRPGQVIRAGQPIGYVGTTGNAQGTSPHLHFSLAKGTTPINPYPVLRQNVNDHRRGRG
jgi:murein DD-endopeptidase MepM/ murein hydrolase activator NlpD